MKTNTQATGTSNPGRPSLALRIGITGARDIAPDQLDRLKAQVAEVLDMAASEMKRLAEDERVSAVYRSPHNEPLYPAMRFLSPLAKGADRLAAQETLNRGYSLHVAMPFPKDEYEKDFDPSEDLKEFRSLLDQANEGWLALDGDHGPDMNRAYEAVGRYVVRHSDIVIAIWDGGPGKGPGGTADTVRYAA